jgi:hypothetical protein
VAAILMGLGGYVFCELYRFYQQVKSEYETIRVVQMVEEYVKTHDGRWPSSWQDLDATETAKYNAPLDSSYYRKYAVVNFALTREDLRQDPRLIYRAVLPLSGCYSVYPHARNDLDNVMELIRRSKPRH